MGSDKPRSAKKPAKKPRPLLESGRLILYTMVASGVLWLLALLWLRLTPIQSLFTHIGFVSLVTFLIFALDKLKSRRDGRRASELNLLALGAIGGALGGLLAMATLRHKTQRVVFTVGLPVLLFTHGVVIAIFVLG